jgi:hypothetical protein
MFPILHPIFPDGLYVLISCASPLIAMWDKNIQNGVILSKKILENPFINIERGKGIKLPEFFVEKR